MHDDDLFDKLLACHSEAGHGGRHSTVTAVKQKYCNIPTSVVEMFTKTCQVCCQKRPVVRRNITYKPILSKNMLARAQMDLIDLQSEPDGDYK